MVPLNAFIAIRLSCISLESRRIKMASLSMMKKGTDIKKDVDRKSFSMSYSKDIICVLLAEGMITKEEYKEELSKLYKYINELY